MKKKRTKAAGTVTEAQLAQSVRELGRAAYRELDSKGCVHTAVALRTLGEVVGALAEKQAGWGKYMHGLTRPALGGLH